MSKLKVRRSGQSPLLSRYGILADSRERNIVKRSEVNYIFRVIG